MDVRIDTKNKLAVWFTVGGDCRFLSHRDTMRFWERALVRARIPVAYSLGFNPHIRYSMPLPRSVGAASRGELLLVETLERGDLALWTDALRQTLPQGVGVRRLEWVPADLDVQPRWIDYRIVLAGVDDLAPLQARLDAFERGESWPLERARRGKHLAHTLDAKRQVTRLRLTGDGLACRIAPSATATVRLDELIASFGIDPVRQVSLFERTAVAWAPPLDTFNEPSEAFPAPPAPIE